jgi:hypothetical protein
MTIPQWIITGIVAWFTAGVLIGVVFHRINRPHHPGPNHPAVRAHKTLHDGRPLTPHEAAEWDRLQQQLRTPDTQESQ